MQFHKQLYKHRPQEGLYGDCMRTCLANLLGYDNPAAVPHFMDGCDDEEQQAEAWTAMREWLAEHHHMTIVSIPWDADSLDTMLHTVAKHFHDVPLMLIGRSKIHVNHVVIVQGDRIIHDPSQEDSGIVGPADDGFYWTDLLVYDPRLFTEWKEAHGA